MASATDLSNALEFMFRVLSLLPNLVIGLVVLWWSYNFAIALGSNSDFILLRVLYAATKATYETWGPIDVKVAQIVNYIPGNWIPFFNIRFLYINNDGTIGLMYIPGILPDGIVFDYINLNSINAIKQLLIVYSIMTVIFAYWRYSEIMTKSS